VAGISQDEYRATLEVLARVADNLADESPSRLIQD
jgi:hypothetical protein